MFASALRPQLERETKTVGAVERDADGQCGAVVERVFAAAKRVIEQLRRADDGEEREARNRAMGRRELQRGRLPRNRSEACRIGNAELRAEKIAPRLPQRRSS